MQSFAAVIAAATALVSVALGQNYTIDYWKDSQYRGDHVTRTLPMGACADLPGGWNDAISSAKIYAGCQCTFYRDGGCPDVAPITPREHLRNRRRWQLNADSSTDTTILGPTNVDDFVKWNYNDIISSIRCTPYQSAYCNTVPQPEVCYKSCVTY